MDPISPPIAIAVNFLADCYTEGMSFSAICTARSALSSYLIIDNGKQTFGNLPCVKRLLKGIFENRPSLVSESKIRTWDVNQVLTLLESWKPIEMLDLKKLTLKVAMLLLLLSGQRCQTIHSLDVESMTIEDNKCVFYINTLLKHSRSGKHQQPLEFSAFSENESLCIITHIKEYIRRTEALRQACGTTKLFISYQKPHNPVSKDTMRRWAKQTMKEAGIDILQYTAHSTRAASTTSASRSGIPMTAILAAAGWSNASTFTRFYRKEIKHNYDQTILEQFGRK